MLDAAGEEPAREERRAAMSDVGEGAGLDFAVIAIGLAEEDGRGGVAVGNLRHVHDYILP